MKTGSKKPSFAASRWRGPLYLDASALVKIYLPEPESDQLEGALRGRDDLVVSDLAITEIVSALARRRRENHIPVRMATRLYQVILADYASGLFQNVELLRETHREAETILLSMESVALRASDALHLALAISAGTASIVTYDQRMREAAQFMGLNILPP